MPIEKLMLDSANVWQDQLLYKINELIDAFNENDRHFQGVFKIMNQQLFQAERRIDELESLTEKSSDSEDTILVCPWCNQKPVITELAPSDLYEDRYRLECCDNHDINIVVLKKTKQEVISAWNTRTNKD